MNIARIEWLQGDCGVRLDCIHQKDRNCIYRILDYDIQQLQWRERRRRLSTRQFVKIGGGNFCSYFLPHSLSRLALWQSFGHLSKASSLAVLLELSKVRSFGQL